MRLAEQRGEDKVSVKNEKEIEERKRKIQSREEDVEFLDERDLARANHPPHFFEQQLAGSTCPLHVSDAERSDGGWKVLVADHVLGEMPSPPMFADAQGKGQVLAHDVRETSDLL